MPTIALIGNPNSGKTTLFNQLTGTTAHVGNWPGVTVEKKEGTCNVGGEEWTVIDLPGIYSLSPYSPEEKLSRRYILDARPDLIVDVIDATNLERSLYLTTQLSELGVPLLLALNMQDLLKRDGVEIDTEQLSRMTGCPAAEISASKGTGLEKLIGLAKTSVEGHVVPACPLFSNEVEQWLTKIIADDYLHVIPAGRPPRWAAIKLLEDDELFAESMPAPPPAFSAMMAQARASLRKTYGDDAESVIIDQRYQVAERISDACVHAIKQGRKEFNLDTILTNRFAAIPLFILIMAGVFYISIQLVGGLTTEPLGYFFGEWIPIHLGGLLDRWGVIPFLSGLLIDGIIAGVGSVLTFVPQLFVLFLLLSLLEDCGYMARIAFIMDRIMRSLGLSGKSIIPLVIGTGCSVPAIMSSRTIEHQKQRELTVLVTSFIPCGAKMPIFALMIGAFFPDRWYVAPMMYFIGILAVVVTGLLSRRLDKHKEQNAFIMELPRYQVPTLKNTWLQTWERTRGFLIKAGTIILLSSAIIWQMQSYSFTFRAVDPTNSMLATLGKIIAPLFKPLGFGTWQASVALLTGIAAKESIVSTLSVTLAGAPLSSIFTPHAALAYMVFILLASPCIAAISAMSKELGGGKKLVKALAWQTGYAYIAALLFNLLGMLVL